MSETKGLTRQQMADRVALEFQDGWIVNLGVGIPTLCSNTDIGDRDIIYHSENGVIGYGPIAPEGQEDLESCERRRAECHAASGCGGCASRGFLRRDPRRAYRGDRDGRLPGACLATSRIGSCRGRRAAALAARWILQPARDACSSFWSM